MIAVGILFLLLAVAWFVSDELKDVLAKRSDNNVKREEQKTRQLELQLELRRTESNSNSINNLNG